MKKFNAIHCCSIILCILLLSACASPEQRAAYQRQRDYEQQQQRQTYINRLSNRCAQYGFAKGTASFAQCIQQAEAQDIASDAVAAQQRQQAFRDAAEAFKPPVFPKVCPNVNGVTSCR